jgi:hypothetical protein
MRAANCKSTSASEPTYWHTNQRKKPNVIDFFIVKGIADNNLLAKNIVDLTSDHMLVLLAISTTVIKKYEKHALVSKHTN